MIPVGQVFDEIMEILDLEGDAKMGGRVWRQIRYQYLELAREVSWASMRAPTPLSLDFSATSDTTGIWLPSDLFGIDLVWDDDNSREFFEVGRDIGQIDEWGNRFYTYYPSRSHLFEGSDLVLNKNGTTFTSASLTAAGTDTEDEYVQFDDELGFYQISNAATPFAFTPTYYGENKAQKTFRVRPWQTTQKMVIINEAETKLQDRTVDVYYWTAPPTLYRKEDMLLLPSAEVLKFRVLRAIPQTKGAFSVSQSMLDNSFKKAVKANPNFSRVASARDKRDNRMDVATNPFGNRNDE